MVDGLELSNAFGATGRITLISLVMTVLMSGAIIAFSTQLS